MYRNVVIVGLDEELGLNKNLLNLSEKLALIISREGEHCFYFPQGHLEQVF